MSDVQQIAVSDADDGLRIDRWFKQHFPQVRHGQLEKFLRTGQVRVDGGRVKASRRLTIGEIIRVPPIADTEEAPQKSEQRLSKQDAEFIRSLVIYEDDALIALNKPFGLAVQGGTNTKRHIDGMLDAFGKGENRPRLVHRLDRDTGGLLLLGKTRKSAKSLGEFFQRHEVEKTYWALVVGEPKLHEGTIDLPVGKKTTKDVEKVVQDEDGKKAITDFQLVEAAGTVSFLALRPRTGRTHQLRVHCAAMKNPIVGDGKYGGIASRVEGVSQKMHLFCHAMTFPHPVTRKRMTLKATLSGHMADTWKFFNFSAKPEIYWPKL